MQINRQTYEEFFLLYNDGELNMEEQRAVEEFIRENPDLEEELALLKNVVFTPDEEIVFENKESLFRKERRVVPFPWMRIAAAASVMILLTIAGSIYLGEKKNDPRNNLATRELIKENTDSEDNQELTKEEPQMTTVSEEISSPSKELGPRGTMAVVKTVLRTRAEDKPANSLHATSSDKDLNTESIERLPEPATLEHDIVVVNIDATEKIDMPVAPQLLEQEPTITVAALNKVVYAEEDKDNTIYFANTSLPKKTKLRGVFRKATRILDKVTSFQ